MPGWRTSEDNIAVNFKQDSPTDIEVGPLAAFTTPTDPATDYHRCPRDMSPRCLSSHLLPTLSVGTEPSLDRPFALTESHSPDR